MKVINAVIAALFFTSAAVQFNDPDPAFWVLLYGTIGAVAVFAMFERYNPWVVLLGLAVCTFELFRLLPAFWTWVSGGMPSIVESMQAESPHVEMVREFLGLVICEIALIFYYLRARKNRLAGQSEG